MADMKDMKTYSRKVTHAKSATHMIAMANSMATKIHPKATSADKMVPRLTKKFGKQAK